MTFYYYKLKAALIDTRVAEMDWSETSVLPRRFKDAKKRKKNARGRLKSRLRKKKDGLPRSICEQALARLQSIQYVKVCHNVVFTCANVCVCVFVGWN